MKCKKADCENDLKPEDNFCSKCGQSQRVDINDHSESIKDCPNPDCDAKLKKGDSFCSKCGKKIVNGTDVGEEASTDDQLDGRNKHDKTEVQPVEFSNPKTNPDYPDNKGDNSKTEDSKQHLNDKGSQKPEGTTEQKKNTRRGFVVISSHSKFNTALKLFSRPNAFDDAHNLKDVFEKYDCKDFHCMDLKDKDNDYYDKKLVKEIKDKMGGKDYNYFIFALSSHGEEKEEVKHGEHVYNHYFYTKNAQYETQQLIDNIVKEVPGLENKLKIFIIQACRSRVYTDIENMELGVKLEVASSKTDKTTSMKNETTLKIMHSSSQSVETEDARGYMPVEVEEEEVESSAPPMEQNAQSGHLMLVKTVDEITVSNEQNNSHQAISSKETVEVKVKETARVSQELEYIPITAIPHCDDGVVVFASMSGKYAYSKQNHPDAGGWLIKAFCDVLNSRKSDDKVHILDVLVDVNRAVSQRDASLPSESAQECERKLRILNEALSSELEGHKHSEYKVQIEEMMQSLKTKTTTEAENLLIEAEKLISTIKEAIGFTGLKSQCCFFHNLAFDDDEDFYLRFVEDS